MMKSKKNTPEAVKYSDKSIKYGVFTNYELSSAIICYDSDFGEMFWAIENLKGTQLKKSLIGYKNHYINRYLEQGDLNSFSHIHNKLITFLELAIDNPESIKKQQAKMKYPEFTFEELFRSKQQARIVIEKLINHNFLTLTDTGYEWKTKGRNTGVYLAALFNYLLKKNYLKPDVADNFILMSKVSKASFKVDRTAKTFSRMNNADQQTKYRLFNFLS